MNGKKDCGFGDEIVSYIYDEMDAAGRRKFESHLASCTLCTDEFAGISDARLSIFEWNREDFAEMPTPEIVIPYAPKPETASAVGGGWFVSLVEMFAFLKSPVTAFAGFAVVARLAGFVLVQVGDIHHRPHGHLAQVHRQGFRALGR